ncbi:MAG: OsmC domain/YcaO domain-containing protein, partial [Pseudomonas sp.]
LDIDMREALTLALQHFEEALELVEECLQFNDNTVEREMFYQALNAALEVTLDDDLEMDDYEPNLRRMFGDERMEAVLGSIAGSVRFYGLTPTSMQLEGLDKHLRLLDSLKKLHAARARFAG